MLERCAWPLACPGPETYNRASCNDELVVGDVITTLGQLQALALDIHRIDFGASQILNTCAITQVIQPVT